MRARVSGDQLQRYSHEATVNHVQLALITLKYDIQICEPTEIYNNGGEWEVRGGR